MTEHALSPSGPADSAERLAQALQRMEQVRQEADELVSRSPVYVTHYSLDENTETLTGPFADRKEAERWISETQAKCAAEDEADMYVPFPAHCGFIQAVPPAEMTDSLVALTRAYADAEDDDCEACGQTFLVTDLHWKGEELESLCARCLEQK